MPPSSWPFSMRGEEFALVEIVGDIAIGQVSELVCLGQVIDGDDVGNTALVEPLDQIRADESAGAGDYIVHRSPS